jgi:hypothetical protein
VRDRFRVGLPVEELKYLGRLCETQRRRCFYCRDRISMQKYSDCKATVDHFFPLVRGGRNNLSNVVLACRSCNSRKANRLPTLLEIIKWNELARSWPHIHTVSPDVHARKVCVMCRQPIPHLRLLESLKSMAETDTCSKACTRNNRLNRRAVRRAVEGSEPAEPKD